MSERLEVSIRSSIMDRERRLIIDPDFIEFDDKDLKATPSTRFEKGDIVGIRYGVRPIRGYAFYIGATYCVDVKHESGSIISIRIKTLYRIRKRGIEEKYIKIVEALFENYCKDLIEHYLNLFNNRLPFELLGLGFRSNGIILKSNDDVVPWEDIGTRDYMRYYALFSKKNPAYYRTFEYLDDWNTSILYSVSKYILGANKI